MKRMLQSIMPLLLITAFVHAQETDDNMNAALWMQSSAEYQALAAQTYRSARTHLEAALQNTRWTAALEQDGDYSKLKPAIILDIDETVLDNGPFQGKMIMENRGKPDKDKKSFDPNLWDQWVARAEAVEIPGALAFIRFAKQNGVAILYVTNRECKARTGQDDKCPQKEDTLKNLYRKGFPKLGPDDQLLLKSEQAGWGSDKTTRRKFLTEKYRILLLFGDDLNDFVSGASGDGVTPSSRQALADEHQKYWGLKWFMLPNPTYGSWLRPIQDKHKQLKSFH